MLARFFFIYKSFLIFHFYFNYRNIFVFEWYFENYDAIVWGSTILGMYCNDTAIFVSVRMAMGSLLNLHSSQFLINTFSYIYSTNNEGFLREKIFQSGHD